VLHGFDSSVLEFRCLLPLHITRRGQLICWGSGLFTERVKGITFDPPAIKTHLYYFWKTLINQPVMLVGLRWEERQRLTLQHPHAVKQLVLINSVGYTGDFPWVGFVSPLDYLQ